MKLEPVTLQLGRLREGLAASVTTETATIRDAVFDRAHRDVHPRAVDLAEVDLDDLTQVEMLSEIVQRHRDVQGLVELGKVEVLKSKVFQDILAFTVTAFAVVIFR